MNAGHLRDIMLSVARVDDGLFPPASPNEDRLEAARQESLAHMTRAQISYCIDAEKIAKCSPAHIVSVIQSLQLHVVVLELERDRAARALRMWLEDDGLPDQPARAMDMARRVVASMTEVAP